MKIVDCKMVTDWKRVQRAALRTMGLTPKTEKDITWRLQMLMSEHSPIRLLEFDVSVQDIKQWVSVHLVRHWLGFIPFVHSQRDDRRKLDCERDELPQGSLNDMDFSVNAQALINISRKRMCCKAHPETRDAWMKVHEAIGNKDAAMAAVMVRECVYRGFCPEMKCCGFVKTMRYQLQRTLYLQNVPKENVPDENTQNHEQFKENVCNILYNASCDGLIEVKDMDELTNKIKSLI